jgi:hypothetical protein
MTKPSKRYPHTPGPWSLSTEGKPSPIINSIANRSWWSDCDRANARLIAAAPDLLAAIVALYNACETPYWAEKYVEARNGALRAIAKATEEGGA